MALQEMQKKHTCIGDLRGKGLFQFVELVKNRETRESFSKDNGATNDSGKVGSLDKIFSERGINIKYHPLGFFITPPLCISREDVDFALDTIDEVLGDVVDPWTDQ